MKITITILLVVTITILALVTGCVVVDRSRSRRTYFR
jgi:hypothetical protein